MKKQKKLLLKVMLTLLIGCAASNVSASDLYYEKGDNIVYGFLGLGRYHGVYGSTSIPPVGAGYEYGFHENISVGGLAGISQSSYKYASFYDWTYTYYFFAGKASYHFTQLEFDVPLDFYGSLTVGYNILSVSGSNTGTASNGYFLWGLTGGVRYWMSDRLAAQMEVGYGIGNISVGIAYKL